MQEKGLVQSLHELRSGHLQDVTDIYAKLRELEDRLNQEESDRERMDTSLDDRLTDLEAER